MTHAYLTGSQLAFLKPKDKPKIKQPTVTIHRDGREVCSPTIEGRAEYRHRLGLMLSRQKNRCCLEGFAPDCPGYLRLIEATFEHENGRGGGKRDDRIEVAGIWINGAAHALCNGWKGSRRIDYNRSIQARMARIVL